MDGGTTPCRRDFVKGVGIIMGAVGLAGTAANANPSVHLSPGER